MKKIRKKFTPYLVKEEKICSGSLNGKEAKKLRKKYNGCYAEGEEIIIGFPGDDYNRCV